MKFRAPRTTQSFHSFSKAYTTQLPYILQYFQLQNNCSIYHCPLLKVESKSNFDFCRSFQCNCAFCPLFSLWEGIDFFSPLCFAVIWDDFVIIKWLFYEVWEKVQYPIFSGTLLTLLLSFPLQFDFVYIKQYIDKMPIKHLPFWIYKTSSFQSLL